MKEYSITYRSDDLCWSSTPYLNVNEYLWNSPKNVSMRAQICYDENALYGVNNQTGKPSEQTAFEILNCALEHGITALDTASG